MNENNSLGSVVVLEEGAEFPKWVSEYQRAAPNSIVIAHMRGESMTDLRARVLRHLPKTTQCLRVGIVACASTVDEAHLIAREGLCRALLASLAPEQAGEVVLAAAVEASEDSKHAIFELAGLLCDSLRDTQRVVRVRFSSGRPESGIMPKLAATNPDAYDTDALSISAIELDRVRTQSSG